MIFLEWLIGSVAGPIVGGLALVGVMAYKPLGAIILGLAWLIIARRIWCALAGKPGHKRWFALLGVSASYVAVFVFLLTRPTLIVTPTSFLLHSGSHANKTSVEVRNIGAETAYAVFLKVWTDNSSIRASDIKIEVSDENPNAPVIKTNCGRGTVEIRTDVISYGWRDSRDRSAQIIRLYSLEPQESRHINVSGGAQVKSYAFAAVIASGKAPDRALSAPQQLIMMMTAPEDGKPDGSITYKTGNVEMHGDECVVRVRIAPWSS